MKISLAGASYTASSVVAAAQQTMNLIPESIESAAEPTRAFMYGRPGLKLFQTLTPPQITAMWAGGGRLFVIHRSNESEIKEDKTVITSPKTVAFHPALPGPAQIFSNGHQLLIISGGFVYCDNGAGPEQCFFQLAGAGTTQLNGTCHTNTNVVTRDTGPAFTVAMVGGTMTINGRRYTVTVFSDADHLLIDPFAPLETAVNWTYTGINLSSNVLTRTSGDLFAAGMTGKPITVNGRIYTGTFVDANHITLVPNAPAEGDVQWNVAGGAAVDATTGCFLDGYGIISRVPTPGLGTANDPGRQFNISGLNDFTFWNPLDFGVKEGRPDYISSVNADHEQLIITGTESTEIWQNIGSQVVNGVATFPFQRVPGAFIQTGSAAVYAPCSVGLNFCFLGSSPDGQTVAYALQGFQPRRISTHAQEEEWDDPNFNVSDAVSYSYIDDGHTFWVINFWAMGRTFVYDFTENLWHERAAWDAAAIAFLPYQAWYHVFIPEWGVGGKHIVGDPRTGKLYEMSLNFYDDDGAYIEYLRAFPHLINEDKWSFHHRLEIYLESGAQPAGDTPLLIGLDWSDNRGHTFAHNRFQPGGISGEYNRRVVFRRLGKSRDRVYRVGIQAKSKVALIDAFLEVTPGTA